MPCPDRELSLKNKASELQLLTFVYAKWQIFYVNCNVVGSYREI